jgi:hypothetical protein
MGAGIISISAGVAILLSGSAGNVTPSQMKFVGAYQMACPVTLPKVDTSTTTPPASKTYIPSMCDAGTASVAVFKDANGNTVYMDIPNSQYQAMMGVNGDQHNPSEGDIDANLQAFIASTTTEAMSETSTSTAPASPVAPATSPTDASSTSPSAPDTDAQSTTDTASSTTPDTNASSTPNNSSNGTSTPPDPSSMPGILPDTGSTSSTTASRKSSP